MNWTRDFDFVVTFSFEALGATSSELMQTGSVGLSGLLSHTAFVEGAGGALSIDTWVEALGLAVLWVAVAASRRGGPWRSSF